MFETIDPSQHSSNTGLLEVFCEKIAKNKILSQFFQNREDSTFLLMNEESKGIFGGAFLVKNRMSSFEKRIRENMPAATRQAKEAWTCTVYLHLENENVFTDFECFSKKFYVELYQKLSEFGHKEGIDYLSIVLIPGEYLCTEVLGFWPYVVEVRPSESGDGLFHGILSLLKSRPKPNPKTWEAYLSEYNRLAA